MDRGNLLDAAAGDVACGKPRWDVYADLKSGALPAGKKANARLSRFRRKEHPLPRV